MSPLMALFGPPTPSGLSPQCATKRTSINVIDLSAHPLALSACDALPRARSIRQSCMARAVGQACERRVAAKTEIRKPGGADRPAASFLVQFEQRAAMSIVDRPVVRRRLGV